jgi:DUF1680 family protein
MNRLRRLATGLALSLAATAALGRETARLEPLSYAAVRLTDSFWAPKIAINQAVSLRAALRECEKSGNIPNFRIASGPHAGRAFKAVPYYAWANRGQGWMTVWIPEIGP